MDARRALLSISVAKNPYLMAHFHIPMSNCFRLPVDDIEHPFKMVGDPNLHPYVSIKLCRQMREDITPSVHG